MTKYLFNFWAVVLLLVILASCGSGDTSLPVLDLDQKSGAQLLHLDELVDDLQLVRLQTSRNILVPTHHQTWVGEEMILIISDENIMKFNREGSFLGHLAHQGKGPGEYGSLYGFAVNAEETKIYLHHRGNRQQLLVLDLSKENSFSEIPFPNSNVRKFVVLKDHILCKCDRAASLELFTMDFDGNMLDSMPNLNPRTYSMFAGRGESLTQVQDKVFLMDEFSDTIYSVQGVAKKPFCVLKVENRFDFDDNYVGDMPNYTPVSKNLFLVSASLFVMEKIGDGLSVSVEESRHFVWMVKENDLHLVQKRFNDFFEIEEDFSIDLSNNYAHIKYDAIDFKEKITLALENPDISSDAGLKLKRLDNLVSEEDNPLLLLGKRKF